MADDRTEEASHRKLSEARRKGQIAKSMDLNTTVLLLVGVTATNAAVRSLLADSVHLLTWATSRLDMQGEFRATLGELPAAAFPLAKTTFAVLLAVSVTSVTVGLLQSGFNFTLVPLEPKLDKLNPINGVQRLFSSRNLIDSLKNLVKAIIVISIGYSGIRAFSPQLGKLSSLSAVDAYEVYIPLAKSLAYRMLVALAVIAVLDVSLQRYQFAKSMRMTKQEVKDEYKQMEGDPQAKGRLRSMRRQMRKRMRVDGVKDARVVITNPTHYAVALAYKEGEIDVPKVVAKGKGFRAQVIKGIAKRHNIEIVEAPPVARALFKLVPVGKFIPPTLYLAVAEILVAVQRLEGKFAQDRAQ